MGKLLHLFGLEAVFEQLEDFFPVFLGHSDDLLDGFELLVIEAVLMLSFGQHSNNFNSNCIQFSVSDHSAEQRSLILTMGGIQFP